MNLVIVAIVVVSAIWVYIDATNNKVGKVPGKGGMFNMSAGGWASVTLLLWIIGFPAYLLKRSALIAQAKTTPVEVSGRPVKVGLLFVIGGVLFTGIILNGQLQIPELQSEVKQSMAAKFAADPDLSKLHMTVERVTLLHTQGHDYQGIATVLYKGQSEQISVDVIANGDQMMWKVPPGSFAFAAQDMLRDALRKAQQDFQRSLGNSGN